MKEYQRDNFETNEYDYEKEIECFKAVRNIRNEPAHKVEVDKLYKDYVRKQRYLVAQACTSLRHVRGLLALQPSAKTVEVQLHLSDRGKRWLF